MMSSETIYRRRSQAPESARSSEFEGGDGGLRRGSPIFDPEKIIVLYPDDGAWKRFHKLLDQYPTTVKSIGNKAPFEVLSLAGSIADKINDFYPSSHYPAFAEFMLPRSVRMLEPTPPVSIPAQEES